MKQNGHALQVQHRLVNIFRAVYDKISCFHNQLVLQSYMGRWDGMASVVDSMQVQCGR